MHGTFSDQKRQSLQTSELSTALRSCISAFGACALFSFVINVLMLASPIYMLQVYDRVLTTGHVDTLIMITLIVTVALAVMCALDTLRTIITIRIGCWLNDRLGPIYLACGVRGRLKGDPYGAQSFQDISQIQSFISTQGLTAFLDFPWAPLFIALIWMLHPLLGVVAVSSAVVLFLLSLANELTTRRVSETASKAQIEAIRLGDAAIRNAEVVHAMGMLPAMTGRWASLNQVVVDGLRRGGEIGGVVLAMTKFVRFFVQVAILGVGAWLVLKSELTPGSMIAGSILLGRALAPVELAIGAWRNFMSSRFAYGRLKQAILDYPPPSERTQLPAPTGRLTVDQVTFVIPNTDTVVLSKISFSVEPGEALAIIGPSGAGKSTLCRLLVGLSCPNVGEIRIDGSQVHHWDPAQLGSHVGYLPQDVELFTGSVRDNIGRMKSNTADEEILEAATLAHAHEMIQQLPQGYDTQIGDQGVRLSGGQRQRVGLARAVFGMPQLIVLDEPNANLDQAGETALSEAIFSLKKRGAALVIVGHRPSTLAQADKILVLKDGFVAMYGPRDEVLSAMRVPAAQQQDHARKMAGRALQNQNPVTSSGTPTRLLADGSIAVRPKQAARLAGICRSNLFRAIRDGQLPARKYGRCTLILVQDLWAWLERLPGIAGGRNHQASS
ncbi:MAG TPA: type I secretion system permease/ATPase [Pseudolabrys sp.]|nr:type I secretion system permease/ATPase [Pseudolabrys sp.]